MKQDTRSFIKSCIRTIPDYPKPGIMFRDVTTLLANPDAFKASVHALTDPFQTSGIASVVAIEARGFIIGGIMAHLLGACFVPVRKAGKLPGDVKRQGYQLEYGSGTLEIHADALTCGSKVLLVDDLIATGGTAEAAAKLVHDLGGEIAAASFIIDLPELGGTEKLRQQGINVHTVVEFSGK